MTNLARHQTQQRLDGAAPLLRTPNVTLGPYYPLRPEARTEAQVWRESRADEGCVELVEISGRVVNVAGGSVPDALIEVWQADELGRYRHPSAPKPGPGDPRFNGYGALYTDPSGGYRFRTLKPGRYTEGGESRAPHIHFQITGACDRLVTQMFFPGEAANRTDYWYRTARRPVQLLATLLDGSPGRLRLSWDIVLATG